MRFHKFTFDSTQDISRHPIIVEARNRHFETERRLDEIKRTRDQLLSDGYGDLAWQYYANAMAIHMQMMMF